MPALVFAEQAMRIVLDDGNAVLPGYGHDSIQLAAHAGVMDHHDSFGPGRDEAFQFTFVEVQSVRTDIDENRASASEHEGVYSGNESERGNDYFVALFEVQQQAGHLQRVRTRRR